MDDVTRHGIGDEEWGRIRALLPDREGRPGRPAGDTRLFVHAVRWIGKAGSPWRDLPAYFGKWNSVFRRFSRWAQDGLWQAVFEALRDPDLEWILLDSTVVRAHQHAAGAQKK